ncbi:MAG: hypothetical protein JWM02_2325 [Frankiales bacterium]|nr:hypothetical protein [Frankiales bacterium]
MVVLGALGFGGFRAFEFFDHRGVVKDAERACGTLDTPSGAAALPSGLTLPGNQKLLRVDTQGKTTLVVASVEGHRAGVVAARDAVVTQLATQGYARKGTDQEPGYEAEAQLGGKGDASVRVRPLCTGRLEVRYTLRG